MRNRLLAIAIALAAAAGFAPAEHRAALVIDTAAAEGADPALTAALEKHGFRCEALHRPDAAALKEKLEAFAAATPTRGTALVYFRGEVLPGEIKGETALCLVPAGAQTGSAKEIGRGGYSVPALLGLLDARGGSGANLVLLDSASELDQPGSSIGGGLVASLDASKWADRLGQGGRLLEAIRGASHWVAGDAGVPAEPSAAIAPPDSFAVGGKAGDEWVNARGMVFCWCPAGSFVKGSPAGEAGRFPDEAQREVRIEDGFWLGKFELTLRESMVAPWGNRTAATHKNHPATALKRFDTATKMLDDFTKAERAAGRLPPDWEYALPTEEQWEYAARAGTATAWSFGDEAGQLPRFGNFGDKSFYDTQSVFSASAHPDLDDGAAGLAVVGSYAPNPWGLHDVHGNVAEQCWNPSPKGGGEITLKGGSWVSTPEYCRSAFRNRIPKDPQENFVGYRVAIRKAMDR
ncbi:MAG: formylglycine-generating enzyme family protein [Verrucomicrobiales bacterium]